MYRLISGSEQGNSVKKRVEDIYIKWIRANGLESIAVLFLYLQWTYRNTLKQGIPKKMSPLGKAVR